MSFRKPGNPMCLRAFCERVPAAIRVFYEQSFTLSAGILCVCVSHLVRVCKL
jgi:hypothetical protein